MKFALSDARHDPDRGWASWDDLRLPAACFQGEKPDVDRTYYDCDYAIASKSGQFLSAFMFRARHRGRPEYAVVYNGTTARTLRFEKFPPIDQLLEMLAAHLQLLGES